MTTTDRFLPQTTTERELLAECEVIARMHGVDVAEVLATALLYWQRSGSSSHQRQWQGRATAADRLLARERCIAEFTAAGLDAAVEVSGFARMTAEQLREEVTYLSDHQG